MLKLTDDGRSIAGNNILIFRTTYAWENGVVEAPWVVFHNNYFYLFYSSCRFDEKCYNVAVARSTSILGPYEKYPKPILQVKSPET